MNNANASTEIEQIKPVFKGNPTAIVFASNDSFAPYMAIMIQSVIDHASENNCYDIIILHGSIHEARQKMIYSLSKGKNNISIRFVDVDPLFENYSLYTKVKGMRLTREAYYRLASGTVLSKDYSRAIYLDGDMITLTDIAELYNIDLNDYYLAATYDIPGIAYCHTPLNKLIRYRKNVLKLSEPDSYFISALLVMNLDIIRRDYPGISLIELAASRNWRQHDQDVLNFICDNGKALLLHPEWNVLSNDFGFNRFLPENLMRMWLESERGPKIIHYGGDRKPWKNRALWEEYFWQTAARTPFWESIVLNMLRTAQQYSPEEWATISGQIEIVRSKIIGGVIEPKRNSILADLAQMGARGAQPDHDTLISVIVPIYNNNGKHLERCLNSIVSQTHRNLEIILIDNDSTDKSAIICDHFARQDQRIRVFHDPHGHTASAIKAGLETATGDYIGWVVPDDWISCDMYEYLLEGAQKYHTPAVACRYIDVNKYGYNRKASIQSYYSEDETLMTGEALKRLIDRELQSYVCNGIWEKRIFEGLHFEAGVNIEDLRVTAELLEKARWITQLPAPKYYRRIQNGKIGHPLSLKNRIFSVQSLIDLFEASLPSCVFLESSILKRFGLEMFDLSKMVVSRSTNHKDFQYKKERCDAFLQHNMEAILQAMYASESQTCAIRLIASGKRYRYLTGYVILWLRSRKHIFVDKLKSFAGK